MSDELAAVETESEVGTELLDVLGDECTRRILVATSDRPMTAKELTDRCRVSSTTVYRRINSLLECDLLCEHVSFSKGRQRNTVYEATFDFVEIALDADGFDVETYEERNEAARLARLLSATASDSVEADVENGELCLRMPLTDEFFAEVADHWNREPPADEAAR